MEMPLWCEPVSHEEILRVNVFLLFVRPTGLEPVTTKVYFV